MPANTNPKDAAKRQAVARQLSDELSLPTLELLLIIGVARYHGFYRILKGRDVCPPLPTGVPGLRRQDFRNLDYNRLYAIIARWREDLNTESLDQPITQDTLNLLLTAEVEAQRMSKEDAKSLEDILVPELTVADWTRLRIFQLPGTPVFATWHLEAVTRAEHDRLDCLRKTSGGSVPPYEYEKAAKAIGQAARGPNRDFKVASMDDIIADDGKPPAALIEDILAVDGIATISGRAKTQKTWCALDLCLSAAAGDLPWLKFAVKRSRTVYVNLELSHKTMMARIKAIAGAREINLKDLDDWFFPITVSRGSLIAASVQQHSASRFAYTEILFERLTSQIQMLIQESGNPNTRASRLIVLDSFYNLCGGELNESSLADISAVYGLIREFAAQMHSAVVNVHHFAKGDPSQKMAGDRAAGSRAHRQEPEAYIELVPLNQKETPDAYVFEADVRDYPQVKKFAIRWQYPLLQVAPDVDVTKAAPQGDHRVEQACEKLLEVLGDKCLIRKDWLAAAKKEFKIGTRTFDRHKEQLLKAGRVERCEGGRFRILDRQIEGGNITPGKSSKLL